MVCVDKNEKWWASFYVPSSLSTSFWSFCTDRSANSARASACGNWKNIEIRMTYQIRKNCAVNEEHGNHKY